MTSHFKCLFVLLCLIPRTLLDIILALVTHRGHETFCSIIDGLLGSAHAKLHYDLQLHAKRQNTSASINNVIDCSLPVDIQDGNCGNGFRCAISS